MVGTLTDGLPPATALVADRAYDARAAIGLIRSCGGPARIPTQGDRKVQRSVDPAIYRQRNRIECFFCKLKHFRRVAIRFDKLARASSLPSCSPQPDSGLELVRPQPSRHCWRSATRSASSKAERLDAGRLCLPARPRPVESAPRRSRRSWRPSWKATGERSWRQCR